MHPLNELEEVFKIVDELEFNWLIGQTPTEISIHNHNLYMILDSGVSCLIYVQLDELGISYVDSINGKWKNLIDVPLLDVNCRDESGLYCYFQSKKGSVNIQWESPNITYYNDSLTYEFNLEDAEKFKNLHPECFI
jgi:hypothetical protein